MSKGHINIPSSRSYDKRCIRSEEQNQNMLDTVGNDTCQKSWPDKPFIFGEQILIAATVACNYWGDGKVEWAPTTVTGSQDTSHFLWASTCEQLGKEIGKKSPLNSREAQKMLFCV